MSTRRTVVLLVVGLTPKHIGAATPNLARLARAGAMRPLNTVLPAVTCSVQSTFTTGTMPRQHGCVANGWYFRELSEVMLWKQSNHLVAGEKIWDAAKKLDPTFTTAKLFWWYNMYSTAGYSVTPRPIYWADGLKLPDFYTEPASLHGELKKKLGDFPLFNFWGPNADIVCSQWIAKCALEIFETRRPSLTLVYLPHLDYDLQRLGPDDPAIDAELTKIDTVAGELIAAAEKEGAAVIVLSEYGMTAVRGAVHVNRALREYGFLRVREERGLEKLDAGGSAAFAVADHQLAHVYVRDPALKPAVAELCRTLDGVEQVFDSFEKTANGLDHPRSGELVLISQPDRWFSYYYWLDDARAPEFARTVDIHRKPGYDPVELFVDPALMFPKLKVGWTLAKKMLGFRYLMDVIPLEPSLVKGSHGRLTDSPEDGPVFITNTPEAIEHDGAIHATQVKPLVLRHLFGRGTAR